MAAAPSGVVGSSFHSELIGGKRDQQWPFRCSHGPGPLNQFERRRYLIKDSDINFVAYFRPSFVGSLHRIGPSIVWAKGGFSEGAPRGARNLDAVLAPLIRQWARTNYA